MMRFATVGVSLVVLLLTIGCGGGGRRSISFGDPDKEDVPPSNYPVDDLGADPAKWTWVRATGRDIDDVVVIPPKMLQEPYRMGEDKDFYGSFEGDTATIQFRNGGVYAVKIIFKDRTVAPEIRIVLVAAGRNDAS